MCRSELKILSEQAKILNESCPLEQCDFAFNLSKQVLVDELTDKQTLKLWFIEFLEAFGYLA
jgi:hypothetical protein